MKKLQRWMIVFMIGMSIMLQGEELQEGMPPIVTVSWLQKHYHDPDLVIIDVRKEKLFEQGHLERAVNMPVFRDLFDKKLMLPKLDFLKDIFSKAGIGTKSKIVAYGDNDMIWAARLYWVAKVLGHDAVGLLDVGYGNWKKGALPVTTDVYHPKRKEFVPNINNKIIETSLSTLVSIGKAEILDGRPEDFYHGKKSHAKRFGHIPTAKNYPGYRNYVKSDLGSRLKSLDELKVLYHDLPKEKKIILYCEDGADAALNYIILEQLGYKHASVYEGSWLEWANDFSLPIEKSDKAE
jgi:thiosulfate/3-mercaptopyruvate sulfurtransferase